MLFPQMVRSLKLTKHFARRLKLENNHITLFLSVQVVQHQQQLNVSTVSQLVLALQILLQGMTFRFILFVEEKRYMNVSLLRVTVMSQHMYLKGRKQYRKRTLDLLALFSVSHAQ